MGLLHMPSLNVYEVVQGQESGRLSSTASIGARVKRGKEDGGHLRQSEALARVQKFWAGKIKNHNNRGILTVVS